MTGLFGNATKRELQIGDLVSFRYNGKLRLGNIDKLGDAYMTIDKQDSPNGFKAFRFDTVEGDITIVRIANGQSGFIQSLKG